MNPIIQAVEKEYLKTGLPQIHPGDTVKVSVRIREGNKERIQAYEGIILKISGEGLTKTMTVRRVFQGVGIERVFLLHSPKVAEIKVLRYGKVRRARLYYLRNQIGKAARIKEKVVHTARAAAKGEKSAKRGAKKKAAQA